MGNQVPTYFPSQVLKRYQHRELIIVRGEGELPLRTFVNGLLNGNLTLENIPNLAYRGPTGAIILTAVKKPNLSELKHPPRTDSLSDIAAREGYALIESSRGCSYGKCVYCTRRSYRFGKGWEPLDLNRVIKNISAVLEMGVKRAEFVDDEFFGDRSKERLQRICKLAEGIAAVQKDRGRSLSFGIMTTPYVLYKPDDPGGNVRIEETLKKLCSAGLVKVYWGIESLCITQLIRYGRKAWLKSQADVKKQYSEVIRLLERLKIKSEVGLIMWDPAMSLEELQQNLEEFESMKILEHNMYPFRPLVVNEDTMLVEILRRLGHLGEVDFNFMRYQCEYQDSRVAAVVDAITEVDNRLPELMTYVYRTRMVSRKRFPGQPQTEETKLAGMFVRANASAYMRLIRQCITLLKNVPSSKVKSENLNHGLCAAVTQTVEQLSKMLEKIKEAFAKGLLSYTSGK
jgi:hypothetical protein